MRAIYIVLLRRPTILRNNSKKRKKKEERMKKHTTHVRGGSVEKFIYIFKTGIRLEFDYFSGQIDNCEQQYIGRRSADERNPNCNLFIIASRNNGYKTRYDIL